MTNKPPPKDMRTLYPRMLQHGPFSLEASGCKPVKGETIPRRHPKSKDKLTTTPSDDVKTIFDILTYGANEYGNAKAIGSRKLVKMHRETKKIKKTIDGETKEVDKNWSYFELGNYSFINFIEFQRLCLQVGCGLRKLGMVKDDRLHLFAASSGHWLAMSHGAGSQSIPIATAYDTLGEEGLKHSLVQTEARAIYTDPHLFKILAISLKEAKNMQFVIYNSDADIKEEDIARFKETSGLTVISFEELRMLGQSNPVDPVPPSSEDLCCIMYTSGSTGAPKGVPLKHKAVIASIAGLNTTFGQYIGPGDKLLAYLPSAHILEYVFENACIFWGGTLGYGNPKTLSDTSVRNCKGDIREFKPTILVGVPAVWESVKKGVIEKVNQSSYVVRNLFWGAIAAKSFLLSSGLPGSGILDAVVFQKIKDATGGQLRICMNGGGPIAKDTQRFISLAITPMVSGYGLTETTCMGALMDPLHWSDSVLGDIPSSIEVKLVDFPDAGYYAANTPPQGEIWIRGTPVVDSYFKNDEETAAAFTDDGWFKTGDIGEFNKDGLLRLIDRKKNLVKTLNGEYIALEKLESVYRSVSIVSNICVYAAEDKNKPIALIVPAESALKKLALDNKIEGGELEDLVHNERLNKIVLQELQIAGNKGGLSGIEIVEGVVMSEDEWTPANGLTTAAFKVNRKAVLAKFQKSIAKAYGDWVAGSVRVCIAFSSNVEH